jgi:hypothetical protein
VVALLPQWPQQCTETVRSLAGLDAARTAVAEVASLAWATIEAEAALPRCALSCFEQA